MIRKIIRRNQIEQIDTGEFTKRLSTDQLTELLNSFRLLHIVAVALLEAAVVFNLIGYTATEFVGNLGVAVFLILAMVARFPGHSRVTSWVTETSHEVEMR